MAVLALVVGVVLGVGTWRTYVAENAGENGETGEDQGRALVKSKETIKPVEVAAGVSPHCAEARRPAGVRKRTAPLRGERGMPLMPVLRGVGAEFGCGESVCLRDRPLLLMRAISDRGFRS